MTRKKVPKKTRAEQEDRKQLCRVICRVKEFTGRTWRQRDAYIATLCGYRPRAFEDVRIGRRDLSEHALDKLKASLGDHAKFITLELLTRRGRSPAQKRKT
jgi:hypothetical protein